MTPLPLGSHPNIVYIVNEFQGHNPTFGTLKRYDVRTGQKTEILKLPNVTINDAQLSADGQWVVFQVGVGDTEKLQLVRMDGQELQTLYCGSSASSFFDLQWSANQQLIVFVSNPSADMYLLNVQSGSLQRVFHPKTIGSNGIEGYRPETWLDATRLYVLTQPLDQPSDTLSILDITRGNDQDSNNLQQVAHVAPAQSGFCWNTDSNYDATSLFISQCTGGDPRGGVTQGPSTISVEPAAGRSQHTIYRRSKLAINTIPPITNNN